MPPKTTPNPLPHGSTTFRLGALTTTLVLTVACGTTDDLGPGTGVDGEQVGAVLPMLTSPFWQSYNSYVPEMAEELDLDVLPTVNSDNDAAQQTTDIENLLNQGVAGLVVAPIDSAAISTGLERATDRDVPVVAVDVAPESGEAYMVVRADNHGYGEEACRYLGEEIGEGKVVQLQGDLASINGRDRSEAFQECVDSEHPDLEVLNIPADWEGDRAASQLDALLNDHPDIAGIYMQAGGVYLAPTLQTLRGKGMLHDVDDDDHIVIVSNDGIPQELEAIRNGEIDATLSQPSDDYARYGLHYLRAALAGQTFEPGPTDHGSEIVELDNGLLEDQLPTPLVTRENVDDPELWGNTVGE